VFILLATCKSMDRTAVDGMKGWKDREGGGTRWASLGDGMKLWAAVWNIGMAELSQKQPEPPARIPPPIRHYPTTQTHPTGL